jgi:hypothetical protein
MELTQEMKLVKNKSMLDMLIIRIKEAQEAQLASFEKIDIKQKKKDGNFFVSAFFGHTKIETGRHSADDHLTRSSKTILGNAFDKFINDLLEVKSNVKNLDRKPGEGLDTIYIDEDYKTFNDFFSTEFAKPIEIHAQVKSSSRWGNSSGQERQNQIWAKQVLRNKECELLNTMFHVAGEKKPSWTKKTKVLRIEGSILWHYLSGESDFYAQIADTMRNEASRSSFKLRADICIAKLASKLANSI